MKTRFGGWELPVTVSDALIVGNSIITVRNKPSRH
jgi:hypothetical protein